MYPRELDDSAAVEIKGIVKNDTITELIAKLYKNNNLLKTTSDTLKNSTFHFDFKIAAELSEYKIEIFLDSTLIHTTDSIVCGDVFIISGQSNARATDYQNLAIEQNEFLRSFGTSDPQKETCKLDTNWYIAQGNTVYTKGAVGVLGLELGKLIIKNNKVPICIINGAVGGTKIEKHLVTSGNPNNLYSIYGRLIRRIKKAGLKNYIKGIIWYQGENNTDSSAFSYQTNFDSLYNSWNEDFINLSKIYVFQCRPGCYDTEFQSQLQETQRNLPSLFPKVSLMSTLGVKGFTGCHYDFKGYSELAEIIYNLIAKDFYNSFDTINISPPMIKKIFYLNEHKDKIALLFDQNVKTDRSNSETDFSFFDFDGAKILCKVSYLDSIIVLSFPFTVHPSSITYIPNQVYLPDNFIIINERGIGAFTFYRFPVTDTVISINYPDTVVSSAQSNFGNGSFTLFQNYPNPFNSETNITYSLPTKGSVSISLYNILGEEKVEILKEVEGKGLHQIKFSSNNLPSGIYFYKILFENMSITKKLIIIK